MIFNFLGSNYSNRFGWRFLLARKSEAACEDLRTRLAERYGGKAHLYHRGRAALREAVRLSGADHVLISGFTCYVVEEAVRDAGSRPVFADVSRRTFNFTLSGLRKAHEAQPAIGAVIVQNTFGIGDEIKPLARYCREAGLTLIEDLAHCPDNDYADGEPFGKVGDLVVLSFGDSKQIDVVAGGALIIRSKALVSESAGPKLPGGVRASNFLERLQPLITVWLRNSYRCRPLARVVHGFLRRIRLLRFAADGSLCRDIGLHPARAKFVLEQWQHLEEDKERRRRLSRVYSRILRTANPLLAGQPLLRYPVLLESSEVRNRLLAAADAKGFLLKDHWYDTPVHPSRFTELSAYKPGSCPEKERMNQQIINLPLHKNISREKVEELAKLVAGFKRVANK
ncbi:hypothetical protein F4X86_02465 [Candidatus Saccharibacteria bacterium]|nr:hypothetical protein [Candidatus Saccharibacteria bacterium]